MDIGPRSGSSCLAMSTALVTLMPAGLSTVAELTMMMPLLHHGMVLCGLPYSESALNETATGGTPYGPSHWAGTGEQQALSNHERNLCQAFGERLARLAMKLANQA